MTLDADIRVRLGALDLDVHLVVEPGETVAVLGPNGAGKSTLLRAIAGLTRLDGGSVSIDGATVDDPRSGTFVPAERRPVAVVFQDHLLFPTMSVLENVAFGLRARGVDRSTARRTALTMLEQVHLERYADEPPVTLSGGQAQRIALVRALAVGPRVLLLDEPLAALDAGTRADVRRTLRTNLSTFDGMRLLVTHDPVDAHALADRVVVVEDGRIVQAGTLADVTAHPRSRYVADLVGVNLVTGTVDSGVMRTDDGADLVIADAADGPSLAVLRPHSIAVSTAAPVGTSTRNSWSGTVADIDRLGSRARVRVDGVLPLTAEITITALEQLALRPGDPVYLSVKATDIEVVPR
mgnify:CR=1 FL=1